MDTRAYYDEFADWYERDRHHGYHQLIDELETELVVPLAKGRDVLEIGCGTGLILRHVHKVANFAVGIDISEGMLGLAQKRGLNAVRASATALPFEDERFDVVYSFKVLSHVPDLDRALQEAERVTKTGGHLLLEFYNPLSIRYLSKKLWRGRISANTNEGAVFTRYDSLNQLRRRLPRSLELLDVNGIRVFTPHAALHRIPIIRRILTQLERRGRDNLFRYFGGFLVLHLKRC